MGRNTMRKSVNNAMRQKLFSDFLKEKVTPRIVANKNLTVKK